MRAATYDHAAAMRGDVVEMTVEQYMCWVREEAKSLPLIGRAEMAEVAEHEQSIYMPPVERVDVCNPKHLPDETWASDTLYTFSDLRRTIAQIAEQQLSKDRAVRVPPMKHSKSWMQFCFGMSADQYGDEIDIAGVIKQEVDDTQSREGGDNVGTKDDAGGESRESAAMIVENRQDLSDAQAKKRKSIDKMEGQGEDSDASSLLKSKRMLAARMGLDDSSRSTVPTIFEGPSEPKTTTKTTMSKEISTRLVDGAWKGPHKQLPTTPLLLQFDQVLTQHLISMHCNWLAAIPTSSSGRAAMTHTSMLLEERCQWLYGLLARLEKPIYHEAAAVLRRLFRCCCALRASLDESHINFNSDLASLNLLILISGTYFGQSESNSNIRFDDEDEIEEEEDEDREEEGEEREEREEREEE